MNDLILTNTTLTMSSREIAELTGKQHKDVLYDIRKMLAELELSTADFSAMYKAENGQEYECFNLDKENTLILVSGYNVKIRQAIIQRWQELENRQPKLPTTYKEALLALIAKEEALEEAIKTKAYIGDKKIATAMNTASQLSKQLDKAKDYATIKRVEKATGQKYKWKQLKDYSLEHNLSINDVFDANYGTVKSYHADAWYEVYGVDIEEIK